MAIKVEISALSAEGLITVSGGTPDQRVGTPGEGLHVELGNYRTAQGHLVLNADGETVKFAPRPGRARRRDRRRRSLS